MINTKRMTLYEMERGGLTKNQWSQRKKAYMKSGMRKGDWFTIRPNSLQLKDIRVGMAIYNTRYEHTYKVMRIDEKVRKGIQQGRHCILVVDVNDLGKAKVKVKELIDLTQFRLVIT